MEPPYPITGLVLAGGESRRMGRSKPGLMLGGRPMASRVAEQLAALCSDVLIVTRFPVDVMDLPYPIVRDLVPRQGPLGGLLTGLFYARREWALALACDLPFLKDEVLRLIAEKALASRPGPRAIVPRTSDGWQPLVAAYSRLCFEPGRRLLGHQVHKMDHLGDEGVVWEALDESEIRAVDPMLDSFTNVNTPEELEAARQRMTGSFTP